MSLRFRAALSAFALALAVGLVLSPARSGPSAQRQQALVASAARACAAYENLYKNGRGFLEPVYAWSVRWYEAQGGKKAGPGPAGEHLKRMAALEATVKAQFQGGLASTADVTAAEFYRVEAEVWLEEAGGKP